MFEDYRRYILSIRNNLIQCGVEFPITSDTSYRDIFELSHKLDSILWFYSILEISGSEDALSEFFLPLNGYYKDKMRTIFYEEFTEFMKDYSELSVERAIRENSLKKGYKIPVVDSAEEVVENIEVSEETPCTKVEDMVQLSQIEVPSSDLGENFVSHGRYIEDEEPEKPTGYSEDKSFSPHGRFIEDEEDGGVEYVEHGRYVEDYYEEPVNEDEAFDTYVEEDFGEEPINEDELYDTYVEEEDYEEPINEDELYDTYVEEEDYQEPINEDELYDTFVEEEYEEPINEDELYDTYVEEGDFILEEEEDFDSPSGSVQDKPKPVAKKVEKQRDLSDYLQDFTNGLLTGGKRAIVRGIKKLDS